MNEEAKSRAAGESTQDKHLGIVSALDDLDSSVEMLRGLRNRILEGDVPRGPEAAAEKTSATTLAGVLNTTPDAIRHHAERIRDLCSSISDELF